MMTPMKHAVQTASSLLRIPHAGLVQAPVISRKFVQEHQAPVPLTSMLLMERAAQVAMKLDSPVPAVNVQAVISNAEPSSALYWGATIPTPVMIHPVRCGVHPQNCHQMNAVAFNKTFSTARLVMATANVVTGNARAPQRAVKSSPGLTNINLSLLGSPLVSAGCFY